MSKKARGCGLVKVVARHGPWTITLDTITESSGDTSSTYTRMRAPYVNKDGFRFTICRKGFFSDLSSGVHRVLTWL